MKHFEILVSVKTGSNTRYLHFRENFGKEERILMSEKLAEKFLVEKEEFSVWTQDQRDEVESMALDFLYK